MDGSQEQPCAIAGGQGQCEGRQAQRGPSWRAMQSPQAGFAQSLGGNLQPANQSAVSGSFFGTKYWKCAESDDGNPKKSMILHRMVPSAPLWPGFQPSDGDYVFMCLAPSFLRSPAVRVTRIR